MKALITGAKGMLGSDLCPIMSEKFEIFATDIDEMDVRNSKSVFETVQNFKPDYIYHLAAITDVDSCEKNPYDAYLTNTVGTKNVALACQKYDAIMVYINSGSIYGGDKCSPYIEFDKAEPKSVYANSKYQGELIVRDFLRRFYIFYAGWMFGGGLEDKKFVAKIFDLATKNRLLKIVDDKYGSPTYTVDFSKGMLEIIKTGLFGKYHLVNHGYCSRYECAKKIIEYGNIDNCKLVPVSSVEFPLPAPRPRMEALENLHAKLISKDLMRSWQNALEEYVKTRILKEKLVSEA